MSVMKPLVLICNECGKELPPLPVQVSLTESKDGAVEATVEADLPEGWVREVTKGHQHWR